jgi:signal transduction histidine kinase
LFIQLIGVSFAFAAGTADNATALVQKAESFIQANGKDTAFIEFTNRQGQFVNGDLYIFAVDFNGVTLAHGGNAKLVGKAMLGLKDAGGKYFIKEFIKVAKAEGNGWVDYKWVNPQTKKIENKSTFVQKVDDYFIGCGIYKP